MVKVPQRARETSSATFETGKGSGLVIISSISLLECATQDAFTVLPTNTVGMIGQKVTLNCALSNGGYSLIWRNPSGNNVYLKGIGITSGNEEHFMVEEGSGNSYNLVVLNADENDAGQYVCDCPTLSSLALAEIILLGKKNTPIRVFP